MTDPCHRLTSFAPLVGIQPHSLILGSMPGQQSLIMQQYYAHPRNAFWPIMGALLGFDPKAPYAERVAHLLTAGFAVWDVLESCHRRGSLDGDIKRDTIRINNINALLKEYSNIQTILFNGGTSAQLFKRHVWPELKRQNQRIELIRLPSTSPAHARISVSEKTAEWQQHIRASQTQLDIDRGSIS